MGFFLALVMIAAVVAIIYYIYRYFAGMKIVATDDIYSQRGVMVDFKAGTMKVNRRTFPVSKITGISLITRQNGRSKGYFVQIEVDDLHHPVYRVSVIGSSVQADNFIQRVCVAVRKAGGPDFH